MDSLVNLRDVGGIPTVDGGAITPGRLLRSDNLQTLTPSDVDALLGLGLSDVVDLRSDYEAEMEGPGPLVGHPEVQIHQLSLFREWREGVGEDKPDERPEVLPEEALPWVDLEPSVELDNEVTGVYLSYLVDRPDSVVAALREIADAPGATLVHCAAGKDRTGTIVALALTLAGASPEDVVADYAASSERVQEVVDRYELAYLVRTRMQRGAHPYYHDTIVSAKTGKILAQWNALQTVIGTGNSQYNGTVPLSTTAVSCGC